MTRTEAAAWVPLLTAYSEGKTIQIMDGVGCWKDSPEGLAFDYLPSHYRIRPEPQRIWKLHDKTYHNLSAGSWDSEEKCQAYVGKASDIEVVEFVEVIK